MSSGFCFQQVTAISTHFGVSIRRKVISLISKGLEFSIERADSVVFRQVRRILWWYSSVFAMVLREWPTMALWKGFTNSPHRQFGPRIRVSSGAEAQDYRSDLMSELKHRPPKDFMR
jgi:hypothetical protein